MDALARLTAGGFGLGRAELAPGTVASAAAALVGVALLRGSGQAALAAAALAALAAGFWALRRLRMSGDPGWVVIDEIVGQWIAMLPLHHPGWLPVLLAFAAFRLFDIVKPGPVGWVDRREGALAVMGDDVIAGALAAAALLFLAEIGAGWLVW